MNLESILPKIEKRYLRYDFSAIEVHDLSVEMANKTQQIQNTEQEKKSATSQFTSKLNTLKESVNSIANKVASGYEIREVECDIQYHIPTQGFKTLTRKDDGQKIVEKMNSEDYNLWNQYNDNPVNDFKSNMQSMVDGDNGFDSISMSVNGGEEKVIAKKK
jgi:hypothetical protein